MIDNQKSATINTPIILWENVLLGGTLTVTNEAAGYEGVNALTQATNEVWQAGASTGTLSFVFGADQTCDCVGFAKHTMTGRTVYVEYNAGAGWLESAHLAVTDDNALMILFTARTADEWRIRITGGDFTLGVVYLGLGLVMPGTVQVPHTPLNMCEQVTILDGSSSRNGQFMGAETEIIGGQANITFEVQLPDFVAGAFDDFRRWFNRGNTFFIACVPDAWPLDMGYVWRDGSEIVPPWRDAVFMDVAMSVRVYLG